MTENTPSLEDVRAAIKAFTVMPPGARGVSLAQFDRFMAQYEHKTEHNLFLAFTKEDAIVMLNVFKSLGLTWALDPAEARLKQKILEALHG